MKFIRLDYVDPGFYIKCLTERDGRKTILGKMLDKFTMTVDDVIAFVGLFSAEFIATFLLLGIGCAALSRWDNHIQDFPRSMVFGLVTLICVEIFGWISGAHMNPTVSLAAFISGKLSFQKFLCYFIAQLLGGLCGYGFLVIIRIKEYLGNNKCEGTCITLPNIVSDEQAFGIELLASMLLAWYCCSVWDKQNQDIHESISIRFGFVMIALIFVTGFYTGGSLNPVRSFIPALYHECWDKHWIYWAGPLVGAIIGALLHDLFWRVDLWFGNKEENDELPTRTMKCALLDFSENLTKLLGIFYRKKNKVKESVDEYEQTLFLRSKKIYYDPRLSYDESCPIKEIILSKQPLENLTQQQQKQQQQQQQQKQQPQHQGQYQPQPLQQPQPQLLEQPQPQSLEQPQPESLEHPHPQSLEQPHPQSLKQPQPQSLKQQQPQSLGQQEPQPLKQPQPQLLEQPQPQSLKQPQPQLLEQPQTQPGPAPKTKVDKSIQVKSKADKSTQGKSRSDRDLDEDRPLLSGKKQVKSPSDRDLDEDRALLSGKKQVKSRSDRDLDEDRALLGGKKQPKTPKSPRSPRSPRSPKRLGKKQPPSPPPPPPPPLQQDNFSERSIPSSTYKRFGEEDTNYPSGNWMIAGSPHFYSYKKGKKFRTIGTQTSFYDFEM